MWRLAGTTTFLLIAWLAMSAGQAYAQATTGDCTAAPAGSSCDAARFYLRGEYLLWWTKGAPAPVPLVSTGLIGALGTTVLLVFRY
jgi:hypothetical protein